MTGHARDPREWKTRPEWRDEITSLCARLNAEGFDPPWSRKTLREYANRKFEVLLGLDALSFDQLRRLRDDLRRKLDEAGAAKSAA